MKLRREAWYKRHVEDSRTDKGQEAPNGVRVLDLCFVGAIIWALVRMAL